MRIVAIIQARMGSQRLPGKALKDIGGETMLARVVRRTRRASLIDEVIVAITKELADNILVAECRRIHVFFFRGTEEDVLDRYFRAAGAYKAETVVRITSDCPLIDPGVVDRVIGCFLDKRADYASNSLVRTYPRGLDTEIMTVEALGRAWREATERYQRMHVTPYIYENPNLFRIISITGKDDYSHHRWTVDEQEDLDFVRTVYARLGNDDTFTWRDVLALLKEEPSLAEINRNIRQKTLGEC